MSSASDWISLSSTLKLSGMVGSGMFSPLTIASYALTRPTVSSDLTVSISCSVYAAPYASSAHTSISPKRWPPNWALPPSGCCVTSEYGPVERAWILSSTRWRSFRMYMKPTMTFWSYGSPVRPVESRSLPEQRRPCASSSPLSSIEKCDAAVAGGLLVVDQCLVDVARRSRRRTPGSRSTRGSWLAVAAVGGDQPRCVSSTWPMFMRLGTPSGLRMMSTDGRPPGTACPPRARSWR